jgi:two-component system, chemotaxis family, sensor kinase CheA
MNTEALTARLRVLFADELDEHARAMSTALLALEANAHDADSLQSLFRAVHTIKGAARAAGVAPVEQACHALETVLADVRSGKAALGSAIGGLAPLFGVVDAFTDAAALLKARRDVPDAALALAIEGLRAPPDDRPARAVTPPTEHVTRGAPTPDTFVRVAGWTVDALLGSSTELLTLRGRFQRRSAEADAVRDAQAQWVGEWRRAGSAVRLACERGEAGAEILRALDRVGERAHELDRSARELAGKLAHDAQLLAQQTDYITLGVRRLRLRSFREITEALPRTVHDLAAATGKEVRFETAGDDLHVDRTVLDALRDAVLPLVRNAVDHGIEDPVERERVGKARGGTVRVAAELRGDRVVVSVSDDGAGLDLSGIRTQAEQAGRAVPPDDRALARTLLLGGLSTQTQTTEISGRGVGLDIVRAAVERTRGTVDVQWKTGYGTTFTIECPPTVASLRAVLVAAGTQVWAIPTIHVSRLVRVRRDTIQHAEGRAVLATTDGPIPLVALARVLGPQFKEPAADPMSVVILAFGGQQLAAAVDELLSEQEVVLQPADLELLSGGMVSGAAILDTGHVAPVLSAPAVITAGLDAQGAGDLTLVDASPTPGPRRQRILVADDSITTRTLEHSVLEAAGYEVATAVDGADAWRLLQERGCDLVVADVDMPRMDGFALCEAIRASPRLKHLPVVLVTALEAPEHRARGLEAGADAYVGKSSFDQESLLDTVRQLLD